MARFIDVDKIDTEKAHKRSVKTNSVLNAVQKWTAHQKKEVVRMADKNFERLKNATVEEFAKWLTELHKEVQKQAYESVTNKIKEYIIKPEESQFEEWEETTFNFYKNWLESEAE